RRRAGPAGPLHLPLPHRARRPPAQPAPAGPNARPAPLPAARPPALLSDHAAGRVPGAEPAIARPHPAILPRLAHPDRPRRHAPRQQLRRQQPRAARQPGDADRGGADAGLERAAVYLPALRRLQGARGGCRFAAAGERRPPRRRDAHGRRREGARRMTLAALSGVASRQVFLAGSIHDALSGRAPWTQPSILLRFQAAPQRLLALRLRHHPPSGLYAFYGDPRSALPVLAAPDTLDLELVVSAPR